MAFIPKNVIDKAEDISELVIFCIKFNVLKIFNLKINNFAGH